MYVLCFTSNTIKHLLAVKYPNRGNPCWFFFLSKSHGRFLIGYIPIYYNIYSEAMANFMRNWRRPSRVCINFSVLFLCMSPSRTIICTFSNVFPPFDFNAHYKRSLSYFWYDNPHGSVNTFLLKTNIRVIFQKPGCLTLSILTGTTVFFVVLSSRVTNLLSSGGFMPLQPGRQVVGQLPPPPSLPSPTSPFRCECISRYRLTQSVSHPATLFDACHTPININKLRTKYFAILASNRPSALLKHSNV